MDTPLYEGQVTYTQDIFKQSLNVWFLKSKLYLIFLFPVLFIILGIVVLSQGQDSTILGIGIFLGIIILLIIALRYSIETKAAYKRSLEQNGGQEITLLTQFFDDKILLINTFTQNKVSYEYRILKRIVENKNLLILVTNAKLMIIIEKVKITAGKSAELASFVRTKLPT